MIFIKKIWPAVFIFIIWIIFSSPYFFQNKIPFASDYLVNFFSPWSAYSGFSSPVKNNAMPDVIGQIIPWKNFTIDTFKQGSIPLWNPYSFSGTAHLANYQSAVLSPLNLLFIVLPFIDAWSILVLLQPLLAGIFMYLFLKSLKISQIPSTASSIAFMFCGFITTWMGYATLGYAILFLPLALFCVEKIYSANRFLYLILLSITLPLSFFSGHFQISLYFLFFLTGYVLFKFYETKNLRITILTFLYVFFGLLLTMPQLLPSMEAYGQSLRSTIFQKIETIPWGYISTFIAPDLLGNPVTRNDWFGHYAEWNGFIGTITIILTTFALFRPNKKIFFFLLTGLTAILLSFQSPLIDLIVFLKIPVLSTSAASRVIVLFSFSAAVLSAFGLENLFKNRLSNKRLVFLLSFWSLIFIFLWSVIMLKLFIPIEKLIVARQNLILPTVFFLLLLIIIFIFKLLSREKGRINYAFILSIIVLILICLDMLRFATKWQPFKQRELFYPQVPVLEELNKLRDDNRIFGNIGGEASIYSFLPSIEGYDAVYNRRYGEFISAASNGQLSESSRSVVSFPKNGVYSQKMLDLLGVKYFVHKLSDGRATWEYPFWDYPNIFNLIYSDSAYQIYKNSDSFPRAFLVSSYKIAVNSQKIIDAMFAKDMDLRKTVVLEKNPKIIPNFRKGTAKIISYKPDKIVLQTQADGPSLLFLSDSFYPGWKAFIDGKATEIYRTDFTFRSINIVKGVHRIEFVYLPDSFRFGITLFGLGILLICGGFYLKKIILFPKK